MKYSPTKSSKGKLRTGTALKPKSPKKVDLKVTTPSKGKKSPKRNKSRDGKESSRDWKVNTKPSSKRTRENMGKSASRKNFNI